MKGFTQDRNSVVFQYDTVKGRVQSLVYLHYNYSSGTKELAGKTIARYDTSGMLTQWIEVRADSYLNVYCNREYNDKGKITKESRRDRSRTSVTTIKYNSIGDIEKIDVYVDTAHEYNRLLRYRYDSSDWNQTYGCDAATILMERTVCIYFSDQNGRVCKSIRYDMNAKILDSNIKKSDKDGNTIETVFSYNGRLFRQTLRYDHRNNNVEFISYSEDGKIKQRYVTKYNEANKPIEELTFGADGSVAEQDIHEYDKRNNETGIIQYTKGKLRLVATKQYDKNNNPVDNFSYCADAISKYRYGESIITYNSHDDVISEENYKADCIPDDSNEYEFEYDNKNNWIKKNFYKNHVISYSTQRLISYFR